MTPKNWNSNVPREKTNLSIGDFLAGSSRSPLILSFSFQASQAITSPLKPEALNLLIFFASSEEIPKTPRDSGSESQSSGSTTLEFNPQQPQPRRSNCGNIPRCRFESEGEAFMIAS